MRARNMRGTQGLTPARWLGRHRSFKLPPFAYLILYELIKSFGRYLYRFFAAAEHGFLNAGASRPNHPTAA